MKKYITNANDLADYFSFYLSETVQDLDDWDCEHLALNMVRELKIEKPDWWDKEYPDVIAEHNQKLINNKKIK